MTRIAQNAARNGATAVVARQATCSTNCADWSARNRYDTIVLDPPAFAKNKAALEGAFAGYKEINLRAIRLLAPGGYLVTCSCSYNVDEVMFQQVVHEAAIDSHVPMSLVEKRMRGRDHPVLVGVPKTHT